MSQQTVHPVSRFFFGRPFCALTLLAGIGVALGCSSGDNSNSTAGVGGKSSGTGGSSSSPTGGSSAQSSSSSGGATGGGAAGGTSSQPGTSTGGSNATGGSSSSVSTTTATTGGSGTGGKAPTGGATTAGGSTGETGGKTSTGGSSTTTAGGTSSAGGASSTTTPGGTSSVGGGATGGTAAGGASSNPVTPQMVSATDYKLTVGNVILDVNPQAGARVSKLMVSTTNIIQPYTCTTYDPSATCNNAGSTFWTSPQSAWDGVVGGSNVWPPVAAIDGNPYTPVINGDHLVLTGTADSTLGAGVKKDISADSGTGWITLAYTITATKSIQVAPWQITRVARGGVIFFPGSSSAISATPKTTWATTQAAGCVWIDDTNQQTVVSSDGSKIVADGGVSGEATTWLANALGGYLFLIKYPNIAQSAAAPSESDTEVYPGNGYIELEAQGTYGPLASAATSTWTVQWRVVPIPSTVTVSAGSSTLVTYAQQQAAM